MWDLIHALFFDSNVVHAMAKGAGEGQGNFLLQMAPFAAVFAIVYFIMIRPQQKKQKEHQNLLSSIKPGDNIVASGIFGEVIKVKDNILTVKVSDDPKINIRVGLNFVSEVIRKDGELGPEKEKK
tara:strand:- start:2256 stop:2630 length:375 start_codon:yes stop_codon:yes gene_type:complete